MSYISATDFLPLICFLSCVYAPSVRAAQALGSKSLVVPRWKQQVRFATTTTMSPLVRINRATIWFHASLCVSSFPHSSGAQWKESVALMRRWRRAAPHLQLFIWQLAAAAPSTSITLCKNYKWPVEKKKNAHYDQFLKWAAQLNKSCRDFFDRLKKKKSIFRVWCLLGSEATRFLLHLEKIACRPRHLRSATVRHYNDVLSHISPIICAALIGTMLD